MKEIRFWVIVVLVVALGVVIWLSDPKIPESVGSYVLFLTLVAVLLYTRETHKLRIQSKRQIELAQEQMELSLRPHLEIVFQRAHFRLHNIGYGPATNIRLDDKIISPDRYRVRLRFICPAIIKKGECLPIEIKILKEDGKFEDKSMRVGFLMPPEAIETLNIKVQYENLVGKRYEYELKIGKDMYIDSEPVDFLLQYLYEKFPKVINPNEIPELYVRPKDSIKLIQYCHGRNFVEAGLIKEHDRVVEFTNLIITSEGIDYLKGRGRD